MQGEGAGYLMIRKAFWMDKDYKDAGLLTGHASGNFRNSVDFI